MKNITKALRRLDSREFREFWLVVLSYGVSISFLGLALFMFHYGLVALGVVFGIGGVLLSPWSLNPLNFLNKPIDVWLRSRFGLPLLCCLLCTRVVFQEIDNMQSWSFGSGLSIFSILASCTQILALSFVQGLCLLYMFHGGFRGFIRRAFTKSPRRQRL